MCFFARAGEGDGADECSPFFVFSVLVRMCDYGRPEGRLFVERPQPLAGLRAKESVPCAAESVTLGHLSSGLRSEAWLRRDLKERFNASPGWVFPPPHPPLSPRKAAGAQGVRDPAVLNPIRT